jgi:hypothetical protein
MTTLELIRDANGNPVQLVPLSNSQDVDGTGGSAQSLAIDAKGVRIASISGNVRFETGVNPEAVIAGPFLKEGNEIWLPINPGDKVAILGGIVNITAIGK